QQRRDRATRAVISDRNDPRLQIDALHDSAHRLVRTRIIAIVAVAIDNCGRSVIARPTIHAVVAERIVKGVESNEESEAEPEWIVEAVRNEERISPAAEPDAISAAVRSHALDSSLAVEAMAIVVKVASAIVRNGAAGR